jgi:nucleoside-diphosphate-sugar epimerase
LITGATGFVGANLARRCLAEGHEVHLMVRPAHEAWRIREIRDAVRLHIVDVCDPDVVDQAVQRIRPEWIFHLSAHGAYSSQTDLRQMIQANLVGTVNLVESCMRSGFEAFVNTGTSSEYGFKDHAPAEDEWLEPNSHYAVTKASATLYCRQMAQKHDLHIPTLRLYSVYGPYEEPARLMPAVIVNGLAGRFPPLVDPSVARDYVYTEDVCDAFLLVARANGERGAIYNVGSGVQTTLREVVDIARRQFGIAAEPQWGSMPNRSWDTSVWVSDNRKITSSLGWRPRFFFADGLAAMTRWLQQTEGMLQFYREARRE